MGETYSEFWRRKGIEEGLDMGVADHSDKVMQRDARSAAEKLMQKEGDDFWAEFGSYRASDLREKPVLHGGAIVLGGGAKAGKKKNKRGNKIYQDAWEGV